MARTPPARWRRILDRFLAREDRGLTAELEEVWRWRMARDGHRSADRWYRRQVRGALARLAVERLRRSWMDGMVLGTIQDLRLGVRSLIRARGFSLAVVTVLGLGIGGVAAIGTLVKDVVVDPLPYPAADRLVRPVFELPGLGIDRLSTSLPFVLHFAESGRAVERFEAYDDGIATLVGPSGADRVPALSMTPGALDLFGARAVMGRTLVEEDFEPGAEAVTVLAHGLWTRAFGGDPGIVGRSVRLGGVTTTVVGVLSPGFHPPDEGELFLPLTLDPSEPGHDSYFLQPVARLAPGVSLEEGRRELEAMAIDLDRRWPGRYEFLTDPASGFRARVVPLVGDLVGDARGDLLLLLGAAGLLLIVALVNAAGLALVHAEGRRQEVAVRTALGGSRVRVARLFVAQGLALGVAAAGVGGILASAGLDAALGWELLELPRLTELEPGMAPAAMAATLGISAGLLLGAIPVLANGVAGVSPVGDGRRTLGTSPSRFRAALVSGQVALALMLVAGSALMLRSAAALRAVELGFEPEGLVTFRVSLPDDRYPSRAEALPALEELRERLAALPGVESAAAGTRVPFAVGGGVEARLEAENRIGPSEDEGPYPPTRWVLPGYFETLGIDILEGRTLDEASYRRGDPAALVSRSIADLMWPGENAVGRRVRSGAGWHTVVGVVEDVRDGSLTGEPRGTVYYSLNSPDEPLGSGALTFVLRAGSDPAGVVPAARRVMEEVEPDVPLGAVRTGPQLLAAARADTVLLLRLLTLAAGMALALGAVGLYGVLSYVVARRVPEIGLRMALGASSGRVRGWILREGLWMTGVGVVAGAAGAIVTGRLLEGALYGVRPLDLPSLAGSVAVLLAVGVAASLLPAVRATRVSPVAALREE